ncbi:MAG: tyrosine-type recombinase/integrase [Pseudonocardia sp.]
MPREKKGRNSDGRSSIFQSQADGGWHGYVTVGIKDNGRIDRRHRRGKTKTEVTEKVRALERARDEGKVRKAGQTWTVEQWLRHWLDNIIAPPAITENAYDAYEIAVRVHLIPAVGAHKLDKLAAEHLERLYRAMVKAGAKPATAHQVHRTVRAALNVAMVRKHITENVATIAKAPKVDEEEIEPYTVDEIVKLLAAAQKSRNSARWAIALALGLRQGEALGVKWTDVDLEQGTLLVRRNRLRPKWKHGCSPVCGRKRAGHCPSRIALRNETGDTKSNAGKRRIGLPDELVTLLKQHQAEQQRERTAAADLWRESGYVFTSPVGTVLHPRTDHKNWKELLDRGGVPDRRLHDARHTAATVLLLLGVAERTVMGVMGWSNTAMAARYQHVTTAIRRDVADRVGGLLWQSPAAPPEGGDGPPPAA